MNTVRTQSIKPHRCRHLNRRDGVRDRLSILTLTIFNHRRRTRQRHTASEHWVDRSMAHCARAIYSARLALFIHGITSAKRTHEVRPAVLVRECSTQLVMYSLDTYVRYFTYYINFQVSERLRKGPGFSGNYLIDYTIGFIIHYTISTS